MPSRQSRNPVLRRSAIVAMLLGAWEPDAAGILQAPSVRLFTGDLVPTPDTLTATFTAAIANYSGYASVTPTPGTPPVASSTNSMGLYLPAMFAATLVDPFVPNTITGYYVMQGTEWVFAERFAPGEAVEIAGPYSYLDLAAFFAIPLQFAL